MDIPYEEDISLSFVSFLIWFTCS